MTAPSSLGLYTCVEHKQKMKLVVLEMRVSTQQLMAGLATRTVLYHVIRLCYVVCVCVCVWRGCCVRNGLHAGVLHGLLVRQED